MYVYLLTAFIDTFDEYISYFHHTCMEIIEGHLRIFIPCKFDIYLHHFKNYLEFSFFLCGLNGFLHFPLTYCLQSLNITRLTLHFKLAKKMQGLICLIQTAHDLDSHLLLLLNLKHANYFAKSLNEISQEFL